MWLQARCPFGKRATSTRSTRTTNTPTRPNTDPWPSSGTPLPQVSTLTPKQHERENQVSRLNPKPFRFPSGEGIQWLLSGSQGKNLSLAVWYVPCSLDSGTSTTHPALHPQHVTPKARPRPPPPPSHTPNPHPPPSPPPLYANAFEEMLSSCLYHAAPVAILEPQRIANPVPNQNHSLDGPNAQPMACKRLRAHPIRHNALIVLS